MDCRLAEDDEDEQDSQEQEGGDMYVKYNRTLHGTLAEGQKPPLSVNFIRKFLIIAKRRGRCSAVMLAGSIMLVVVVSTDKCHLTLTSLSCWQQHCIVAFA